MMARHGGFKLSFLVPLLAHLCLLCFTTVLVLKLEHSFHFSWWVVFLPLWLFHASVSRCICSMPAPNTAHEKQWNPCHSFMVTPLLISFEILLCCYLAALEGPTKKPPMSVFIVFLPLILLETVVLADNFRMCMILMPAEDDQLSDEALWETLPHFAVTVSMVFLLAATTFAALKLSDFADGFDDDIDWWALLADLGIGELFAFLLCTKWVNPFAPPPPPPPPTERRPRGSIASRIDSGRAPGLAPELIASEIASSPMALAGSSGSWLTQPLLLHEEDGASVTSEDSSPRQEGTGGEEGDVAAEVEGSPSSPVQLQTGEGEVSVSVGEASTSSPAGGEPDSSGSSSGLSYTAQFRAARHARVAREREQRRAEEEEGGGRGSRREGRGEVQQAEVEEAHEEEEGEEDQELEFGCGTPELGGLFLKAGLFAFQVLLCMRLEGQPQWAASLSLRSLFLPLFLAQLAALLSSILVLLEHLLLLYSSDIGRRMAAVTSQHDPFMFLTRGSKLAGWWSRDDEVKEERKGLIESILPGYETFDVTPPDHIRRMRKGELAEEVVRLQSALVEQAEASKAQRQEFEKIQQDKILCRICYERDIGLVLLPCRHRVLCFQCAEKCKQCPICRRTIRERMAIFDV